MNKTKHFKRLWGTLLLLIAMLLPHEAWATDFISEIKVSVENGNSGSNAKKRLSNDGYQIVNVGGAADLNGGAGGSTDYVYIGYKTSTNASDAITGLLIVESSSDPKFDAHAFDNITNANVIYNGKKYYRCDNYKVNDDGRLDCDLNRHNSKGADIVLFYTKEGNTSNGGTPLTSITVVGNTTETGVTYTRHWQYGTAQDGTSNTDVYGNTNQGNGTAHYITYTTHTHAYTAAFNWATNGKSCTATTNCAGCGDTHSNLACTVTSAPKSGAAATCTVMGWTTYTAKITSNGKDFSATKDVQDIAALGHGSTGYNESYSWTGNAYNDASQDTKACTFTLTCKKCSTKVVNGASLTCIKTAHVDATCRATGSTTYQVTGSYTAANSAYNYSAIKTNVYTVAALGHGSTGYNESYSWTGNAYNDASKDTKACIFTLTCKNCSTKVVNGALLTCIKTAHVDATCTATGSTTYQATGSYTAANSAYNYSAIKTNVYTVAALGHGSTGYTDSYSWTGNAYNDASKDTKACTFTLTCKKCSTKVVNGASLTCTKTAHEDASCTATGSTTYQATGSYTAANSAYNYSATKTHDYTITALDHDYANVVDGDYCASAANCGNDAVYFQKCSRCDVRGEKWTDLGSATGLHTFDADDIAQGRCTVCNHGFFRYSASKKVEPYDKNQLLNAEGVCIYDEDKHTFSNKKGVMEFNSPLATIGYQAFFLCRDLSGDIIIPNTVTSIGEDAFNNCYIYGKLILPNSITSISNSAFRSCGFTGKLTIPTGVTSIGDEAFCNADFSSVVIPNSVTSIGNKAFAGNSVLTTLSIPGSVMSIGGEAFRENIKLTTVNMQSVPKMGQNVFYGDYLLETKNVVLTDDSFIYKGDGSYFPDDASVTAACNLDLKGSAVADHANLTLTHSSIITDAAVAANCGETGLAEGSHCDLCHTVFVAQETIPATGHHTFDDVIDPHHTLCTVCGHSFFRYTSSTKETVNPYYADALMGEDGGKLEFTNTYVDGQGVMEFKGTLKTIGNDAFNNCSGFTGDLTIPNSVTSIGEYAFVACSGFTGDLTIPNSVTSIGTSAFEYCSGFNGNLTIPNSVTSIGTWAFCDCYSFTGDLTIPNSVTSIGEYAFSNCHGFNGNLTIPNSVTSIGVSAFEYCYGFNGNLTIPNSVTSIGESAFSGCFGFNGNLTIPNSVTSIGYYAFDGCKGLTGVELNSVPQIEYGTFDQVNCSKTVVLSDNSYVYKEDNNPNFPTVASVTAPCTLDLTGSAVAGHRNLTRTHSFTAQSDADTYLATAASCEDATYYYKCANCAEHNDKTWAKAGTSTGIHTFAEDDLAKGECTVCHHGFLRYTTSDNKVANLSEYAGWMDVKSNTYANGEGVMEFNTPLGYISDNAFRRVTTLTSITIPNTVTGIGYCAFYGCTGLTGNLIIPGSVESIGQSAFCDCSGLNGYVEISNPNTQMRSDAFGDCNNVTEFRMPCSVDVSNAGIASERITRIHEMMTEHPAVEVVDCGTPGNKLYYTCSRTNCQDMYYKNLAGTEAYTGKEEVFTTLPHVFAAGDTEKSECPTCHHGFFRYTSKDNAVVTPNSPAQLKAANNETLTIVSNTNVNGEGVMEFNKPLAIIGESAFLRCTNFIGKLTIPSTVTRIKSQAFAHCDGFTGDLTIPNSVKDIGSVAFSHCTGFNGKLTLSNQLDSISHRAFYGCNNLTGDLVIPNSVKEIGMYAFSLCSGFNGKLSIPNSVEIIDFSAFYDCSGLNGTLTIPESVRWIEVDAFTGCSGFDCVEIKSLPYIELDALSEIATTNKVLTLSENSYIYRLNADEEKYDFPEVVSATAPCTLDLTNSVMENNPNLTLTHSFADDMQNMELAQDGYFYKGCDNCGALGETQFCRMFGEYYNASEKQRHTISLSKVGSYYFTSLYTDFPYTVSKGAGAHIGVVVSDDNIQLRPAGEENEVANNCGVVLKSETPECVITYDPDGWSDEPNEFNCLTGSATDITETDLNTFGFALNDRGYLGFWNWPGMTIPAWKAYLYLPDGLYARGYRLVLDDVITGIANTSADAPDAEISYDMAGRRVNKVRGLGIVKGQKVYVKKK